MPNCNIIDPLVTPYIDGELSTADRDRVAQHLRVCRACHSRVAAEESVRTLIHARRSALSAACAPEPLRAKCAEIAGARGVRAEGAPASLTEARVDSAPADAGRSSRATIARTLGWKRATPPATWRSRLTHAALAASLVLVVGGAFVYQITDKSTRVMAAELTADHVKCFAMSNLFGTRDAPAAVEASMVSRFGWEMRLPDEPARAGLELIGGRPCLYGEGKVAHIMYRHRGRPMSLFMLPNANRSRELIEVFGHQAAIWCVGSRTFVLISREPKHEVEQMAAFVQASLR